MPTSNNKRIAKNTLMLYFRMLLIMGVSLFTVRVILNTLGTVDYGIYNVVGGIVVMFSFLSNTMASASQRFFSFELGKKDYEQLKKTFSMTVTIYGIIAIIILVLAETIGLWFLNTQMTIPAQRMEAANWVYQFSILSFIVTIMSVPYNAAIIAHENMKVYAYVSIIEVLLKLGIVYLLLFFMFDKLKLYAILIFGTTVLIRIIYSTYCRRKYEECRYTFYWDKGLFKILISYSGWSLFGSLSGIMKNYGVNIILNLFFGPIVNAARGISYQISNAINQFSANYFTAVNPQIIKYYAEGERKKMIQLVFQSSKLSYFLLFILSMPVLLETNFVLKLWLKNVPEFVEIFTVLVIIDALINTLAFPMMTAVQATGNIKKYQATVGGTLLLNLPISYFLLKIGFSAQSTFYVAICLSLVCLLLRLFILKRLVGLSIKDYFLKVFLRILLVTGIVYIVPLFVVFTLDDTFLRFVLVCITGVISSILAIYFVGLSGNEQDFFINIVKKRFLIKAIKNYKNE